MPFKSSGRFDAGFSKMQFKSSDWMPFKWSGPILQLLREREGVEAARGNGHIGPDCGASDPGAPSGLPDDLNGILPELASADFSKEMLFKWSGLDAI